MPTVDSDARGPRGPRIPALVLAGSLVVGLVFLATQARQLYFFGDDWNFLLDRSLTWPEILRPHNEHWSTLPVIWFRTMFHAFGIDHYLAYALLPILLHLACCALIYLLMRRSDIAAWPAALSTIPVVFLCGGLGENPLWDFQVGFLGSATLGLCALHLLRDDGRPRTVLAWLVTVASLMCSGMALVMLMWLGAYVLLARGLAKALVATFVPGLVYLTWFQVYGSEASGQAPNPTADQVVEFTAIGLTHAWQAFLRLPDVGATAILGLAAFTLLARLTDRQRALALSGLLTLLATYVLLAFSRAGLGPGTAGASRYSYFALLFTLPAFALVLSAAADRMRERRVQQVLGGALLVVALVGNGVAQTLAFTDARVQLTQGLRPQLLATEQLIAAEETFLVQQISLPYNVDIDIEALSRPTIRAALPDDAVRPIALLDASAKAQVASSPDSFGLDAATDLELHSVTGTPIPGGCVDLVADRKAWVDLPPSPGGSQVQLTSETDTYPARLLDGKLVSAPIALMASAGTPTYIATTSTRGTLHIKLPPGRVRLCLNGSAD